MEVLKRVDNIIYIALDLREHPIDELGKLLKHFNIEQNMDILNSIGLDLVETNDIFYQIDITGYTGIYTCDTNKLLDSVNNNTNKKKA